MQPTDLVPSGHIVSPQLACLQVRPGVPARAAKHRRTQHESRMLALPTAVVAYATPPVHCAGQAAKETQPQARNRPSARHRHRCAPRLIQDQACGLRHDQQRAPPEWALEDALRPRPGSRALQCAKGCKEQQQREPPVPERKVGGLDGNKQSTPPSAAALPWQAPQDQALQQPGGQQQGVPRKEHRCWSARAAEQAEEDRQQGHCEVRWAVKWIDQTPAVPPDQPGDVV
mmetsp:Transcript_42357/g.131993  ORF Transcript_42357/g.131993 Transcript_42357/m.131993 type:complete len:229 (+) Transcript_42357:32-718(+)